ncbi:hypothetical protein BJ165DRAFT_1399521 [Panaeolus papilionaceus]|nr:hypothetical protein BJ165DRAFT_1399521 [Panaeolus papilionaceus]
MPPVNAVIETARIQWLDLLFSEWEALLPTDGPTDNGRGFDNQALLIPATSGKQIDGSMVSLVKRSGTLIRSLILVGKGIAILLRNAQHVSKQDMTLRVLRWASAGIRPKVSKNSAGVALDEDVRRVSITSSGKFIRLLLTRDSGAATAIKGTMTLRGDLDPVIPCGVLDVAVAKNEKTRDSNSGGIFATGAS